jgi:GNAT superfamily N-acetyltransferase
MTELTSHAVTVRQAGPEDLAGVVDTCAALFAEDAGTRDPLRDQSWPREHGGKWVAGLLADDDALVAIAVADGSCVGHLVGSFSGPSEMWLVAQAELVSMYVRPAYRGDGTGARLVDAFKQWGRERGAGRLTVDAYAANEGALRFYARNGFAPHSISLTIDG